jgi:glycosyltransferase involved in cell wall biosynthesis
MLDYRKTLMHIAIVCDPGHVDGGAAKVAIASARGLADAGVAVDFICTFGPLAPELDHPRICIRCLNMPNVWERANILAAAAQGIWNGAARIALDDILRMLPRETVVHFHQWTKSFSPSVLAAPARAGLPAIVSLHDYFLACPNGAYYRFGEAKSCAVAPLSGACLAAACDSRSTLHKAVRVARQYATVRALDRAGPSLSVLNVSPFAEKVMDGFIPARHRRFVVRSPIAVERSDPVPVAENSQFVFVGRMTQEKGVPLLAKVAQRSGLPVTFVGDGPLLADIRTMGLPIQCTGWRDAAGVEAVLRGTRALVFPSTWYETGGLVVLEALARGIPALVSRTTAAADFITDGENGFLIDPGDADQLETCLRRLADDTLAEKMGRSAYERYWAGPQTLAVHVANLLEVYRAILTRRQLPADAA